MCKVLNTSFNSKRSYSKMIIILRKNKNVNFSLKIMVILAYQLNILFNKIFLYIEFIEYQWNILFNKIFLYVKFHFIGLLN